MSTGANALKLERLPRREQTCRLPKALDGEEGLVLVDATWGTIQPMMLAPGVQTIGELELIEHLRAGHGECSQTAGTPLRYAEKPATRLVGNTRPGYSMLRR
jgi:hypothetical protein